MKPTIHLRLTPAGPEPEEQAPATSLDTPPCHCGNPAATWHGDPHGRREYSCTPCYDRQTHPL